MDKKFVNSIEPVVTSSAESPIILGEWMIHSERDLDQWAVKFSDRIGADDIVLLKGAMGSGKTTLVRSLMKALKGEEASSPTFSLVNEYRYPAGDVYHFDLYRMDQPAQLEEIGFEEYLDKKAICLIEWPELGENYYEEEKTTTLFIEVLENEQRKIKWLKGINL